MKSVYKGLFFGAVASATYGMNPMFTLPMYKEGLRAESVLMYRYMIAVAIMALILKCRRIGFRLTRKELLAVFLGGLLFSFSSLTLFLSYNYMDGGIASTMLFVYPLMVAVIMTVFFREKLTVITVCSIVLALSGIGLLYKNEAGVPLSTMGLVLIMTSALSYAVYIVGVNQSVAARMHPLKLTFYVILFGMLMFLSRLRGGLDLQPVPSLYSCFNILMLALLPTIVSLLCTNLAILYLGSTPTAILGALEPVTAVFFGVLLFDESFTLRIALGIFLIILAVTLVIGGKHFLLYLKSWLGLRK